MEKSTYLHKLLEKLKYTPDEDNFNVKTHNGVLNYPIITVGEYSNHDLVLKFYMKSEHWNVNFFHDMDNLIKKWGIGSFFHNLRESNQDRFLELLEKYIIEKR